MLIVLEGLDGCGKTTQANLISKWLTEQGNQILLTAEPSDNRIGKFIREILAGTEKVDPKTLALLFTADRYEHLQREVKPALDKSKIVIMERYVTSTIAYQAAQDVDEMWLSKMNEYAIKADLTVFIDMKPELSDGRTDSGEIFENKEFQEKVYKEYMKQDDMIIVDGHGSVDEVFENIKKEIKKLF